MLILSFLSFISVAMAFYLSFHIYYSFFANKLMFAFILIVVLTLFFSYFWLIIISKYLPDPVFKTIRFGIYFLLGIGIYIFSFYLISDILRIFIKINPFSEGIIIVALGITFAMLGYLNTRFIRENNYTIYSSSITKPLKVVLISDLHIGSSDITIAKFNQMTKKINAQNADFIIMAGDIIDDASVPYQKLGYGKLFKNLNAKHGVYATIGNHETYRGDVNVVETNFRKDGLKVLDNSAEFFKDYNLNLVGITDTGRNNGKPKLAEEFNLQKDKFNLVVEHNPIRFDEGSKHNIDLQLSGHTHGGQISYGYIIALFMYTKPWGKLELNNSTLITTSGIGSWGIPMRDVTYPEIVVINIEPINNSQK